MYIEQLHNKFTMKKSSDSHWTFIIGDPDLPVMQRIHRHTWWIMYGHTATITDFLFWPYFKTNLVRQCRIHKRSLLFTVTAISMISIY